MRINSTSGHFGFGDRCGKGRVPGHGAKVILASLAMLMLAVGGVKAQQQVPLRDFVSRIYVHGFPMEEAVRYGSAAVPDLIRMLEGDIHPRYRENVVFMLGAVGSQRAEEVLIEYVERGGRGVSLDEYHAKSNALVALGYIAHRTGSSRAMVYLKESLRPETWRERGVEWRSPNISSPGDRTLALVRKAVIGLAMTGRPEAENAIISAAGAPEWDARAQRELQELADVAIKARRDIERQGLLRYLDGPN